MPPSGPNPYKTERDVLNVLSSNNPQAYVSFGYGERNVGHPIYKYGKGHMTGPAQGDEIHPGDDIWMPDETPVGSLFAGKVVCVGDAGNPMWGQGCGYFSDDNGGLGNITVLHDVTAPIGGKQRQLKITYGHMSSAVVRVGDRVDAGEIMGRSGTAAEWHHIHLDVVTESPELNNPQIWNNPGEYHLNDPIPTILSAVPMGTSPPDSEIVFGRVPLPIFKDRIIPDANNRAWNNLGKRTVRGVVYHRQQGSNWGTDDYFRKVPPGGVHTCPPAGTQWVYGGCNGLTDWGVDSIGGETLLWNSPSGHAGGGASANRAPWASGPWKNIPGDGQLFVAKFGVDAINRDLASIEVDGWAKDATHPQDDLFDDAAIQQTALITAYHADQAKVPWDQFPHNPHTGLTFTYFHNEFCGTAYKSCPGERVMAALPKITERAKDILKRYQTGQS